MGEWGRAQARELCSHTCPLPLDGGEEGERGRVSRDAEEEETAGGDEGTAIPEAISLTHPRSWE